MDYEARIAALEARIVRLEEENHLLARSLGQTIEPSVALGLTHSEARLVGILAERGSATTDQIMHACYSIRTDADMPEPKIIDVFVCKARKKLRRFDIIIETVWGQGYAMPAASRERLRALCEESGHDRRP